MIDLSKQYSTAYPIKLVDGTILKIKKPTQNLLMRMVELQEYSSIDNGLEVLSAIYDLATDIFNRNYNDKEFTRAEMEEMLDLNTLLLVIQDYLEKTVKMLGE